MGAFPTVLPASLSSWGLDVTRVPLAGETKPRFTDDPDARACLARLLHDPGVAQVLANTLRNLQKIHKSSALARLKRFLESSAVDAAETQRVGVVSREKLVKTFELLAGRCKRLAKDLRKLDDYPATPEFGLLPRRSYRWEEVLSRGERAQSTSTDFIPLPDYLERVATMLVNDARSWSATTGRQPRRLTGRTAKRNRLVDGLIETAFTHLEEVPYALVANITTVLTGVDTDEKTVRDRSKRFFVRHLGPTKSR